MDLKEDKARMCALEPNTLTPYANKNLELGKVNVDLSPRKTFHMPQGGSVHSNVKGAVVKVTNKPLQATLSHKLNEQKSVQSERCLLFKGQQLDFFEALKKKLNQKDLENQQIVRLLLIKHQELRDVKEILKLKEVEAQLMAEKLKCEEKNNSEFAKRFNTVFEDMREKFSVAKSNKESYAKQLKALLEKYERLKRYANTVKLQLREERTKKKSSQKTVIKIEQMAEELLANQNFLEKQRDALASELAMCRKKLQTMKEEHKKHVGTVQRVGEERSAIRVQYENLREELCKTQEDNKKLRKAVQTKDLERARAVESLEQSENVVKQLQAELKESKTQRESIHQQVETMKKEINLIHKRHIEERLQLQEQHKTSMKQLDNIKIECDTLNEIVSNLKKDKNILKQELECLQKEKAKYETASKLEGERLRKTLCLLERERELLLDEMEDLRKDYFSLSDRITQRLGQLDQDDAPMFITDISSFNSAPKVDNTVPSITTSVDSE
ncbi:flagellar attachment zone protein 1 [Hoplias malabaricus]|uniref:flagellar attachment zone protein 1 n=1 Tax=Hoplias malabaricus TaxID=27720 RepID=UPI00346282BB